MGAKVLNYLLIIIITFLLSCTTSRVLPRKQYKPLADIMQNSPVFSAHFTGFALFDPDSGKMLYQQNADKYFTPASNTKLFTFYTALHVLGDSLPLLHYALQGDSLVFQGAGNPLVLHPDFDSATRAIEFLQDQDRRLLHPSDNFIAEQLLLMCADELFGELNTERMIEYARDSLFRDLPDPLEWWDGSGLSRYNLFTPRTMTALLHKIYREVPRERIFDLFPTGGVSGTIANWYGGDTPYVFAKTGTLRNKHCLSGYVRTHSGRVLIFSFMHNNYTGSTNDIRKEMQRVLELVRTF